MVVLNRIYTRTGDDGTTALASGERRRKSDLRVEAYGTVDEANSAIGVARLHTAAIELVDAKLARIQNDLFDLGADLSFPLAAETGDRPALRIIAAQVERIESEIDELNADLKPLRSFVLPGGTPAAAQLHVARTVVRRAERLAVELTAHEDVNHSAVHYLNRLSDFLFVAARFVNDRGVGDILWVPGKNR